MAVNGADKSYAFMEFPLSMSRQDAFPLDRSSVKYSLAEAMDYAANSPLAYVGQPISVVVDGVATLYVIKDTNGTLQKPESNVTYDEMVGATADTPGMAGLVPTPGAGTGDMFLAGDGTFKDPLSKIEIVTEDEIDALFV